MSDPRVRGYRQWRNRDGEVVATSPLLERPWWRRPPRFDVWFWLLVIWAFVVPYMWDDAHVRACDQQGKVMFDTLFSYTAFDCKRHDALDH